MTTVDVRGGEAFMRRAADAASSDQVLMVLFKEIAGLPRSVL